MPQKFTAWGTDSHSAAFRSFISCRETFLRAVNCSFLSTTVSESKIKSIKHRIQKNVTCLCFFWQFFHKLSAYFLKWEKNNAVFRSWQNIFHGSMPLDQLYLARPLPFLSNYRSPVKGLYLCSSGSHPGLLVTNTAAWWRLQRWQVLLFLTNDMLVFFWSGGGVMGSPGWNAALAVMADLKHQWNIWWCHLRSIC